MSISRTATVLAVCGAVTAGLLGARPASAQHADAKEAKIEKAVAILIPTKKGDGKVQGASRSATRGARTRSTP
jgi:hypothetical protein